jgi:hypothetical protein
MNNKFKFYFVSQIILSFIFFGHTQAQKNYFDVSQVTEFDYGYNFEISAGGYEYSSFIPIGWNKNGQFLSLQLNNGGMVTLSPSISIFNLKTNKLIDIPFSSNPDDYEFSDELKNQKINEAIKKYKIDYLGTGKYVRKKELPLNSKYTSLKFISNRDIFKLSAITKNGQEAILYSAKLKRGKMSMDEIMEGAESVDYVGYFIHPGDSKQIMIILMHKYLNAGGEHANVYSEQWIGFRLD